MKDSGVRVSQGQDPQRDGEGKAQAEDRPRVQGVLLKELEKKIVGEAKMQAQIDDLGQKLDDVAGELCGATKGEQSIFREAEEAHHAIRNEQPLVDDLKVRSQ